MKVAIRVDSSYKMGSGHLMRCLTLAAGLRERKCKVSFLCRELLGNMIEYLETKEYKVYRLPYMEEEKNEVPGDLNHSAWLGVDWRTDAVETKSIIEKDGCTDWLIVDHYALDRRWEEQVRPFGKNIMVIDDLADRPHDCDLLLDQNLYENMEIRYDSLVPEHCKKLLGPRYALLRPEFVEARKRLCQRDGIVRRILIFFGGVDPSNETGKVIEAVRLLNRQDIAVDVVVGGANSHKEKTKDLCLSTQNFYYYNQVENMSELMGNADLAIGAGGSTTWERCFMGLPCLTIIVADNQAKTTKAVASKGAIWNLGWNDKIQVEDLAKAINKVLKEPDVLKEMSFKAKELMGGLYEKHRDELLRSLMENNHALA